MKIKERAGRGRETKRKKANRDRDSEREAWLKIEREIYGKTQRWKKRDRYAKS